MDRASGSGVFARDPDALLDLIELEPTEELLKQEENKAACMVCIDLLKRYGYESQMNEDLSQDDLCNSTDLLSFCNKIMKSLEFKVLNERIEETCKAVKERTAWRIDGTLREFPKFKPINLWFDYPIHREDDSGALQDIKPEDDQPAWKKAASKNKKNAQERKADRKQALQEAIEGCNFGDIPSVSEVAEYLGISERTVRDRIKEHGGYVVKEGNVHKKEKKK